MSVLSNGSSDLAGNFFDILVAEAMFQSAINQKLDYSATIRAAFDAANELGEKKFTSGVPLRSDFSNLIADYVLLSIFARLLSQNFPQEVGNIKLQPRTTEHPSSTQYYNSDLSLGLFNELTEEKYRTLTEIDGITETDLSDLSQKLLSYRNSQVECLSGAIQRFNANQPFEIQSYSVTVRYAAAKAHFGKFIVEYNPQMWNAKQLQMEFSPAEVTKAFTSYSGLKDFERSNLSEAINKVDDNTKLLFRETENNSLAGKESPIEYIVKGYSGAELGNNQELMTLLKSLAEELKKNGRILKESIDKLELEEGILIPNDLRRNYDISKMLDVKIKIPLGRASLKDVREKTLEDWIDIVGIRQIEQMIDKVKITLKETDEKAFQPEWMILTGRGSKWGQLKESLRDYCAQENIKPSGELGRVDENYAKYAVVNGMGYHKYWSQVDEKEGNVIENAKLMTQPYYYAVLRAGGNFVQSLKQLKVPDGEKWHTENFSKGELEIFTTFECFNSEDESEETFYHRCVKSRVMKRVGEVNKTVSIDICKESDGSLTIYYHDKDVFEGSRDFQVERT
ncbi:hypothetical protein MI353_20290, partial [Alteromonas sp. MCA-1]|uniref:hypothetical protein n=1 Tax=Alteromonas sp. MCA-1 TaxID=2917731 RepID=UPI001EF8FF78